MSNFEFENIDLENDKTKVLIGIRMPNGSKKQKVFQSYDALQQVLNYAIDEMRMDENFKENSESFALLQMPNTVYDDLNQTLEYYQIENRSMFFVIDKKLLSLN